MLIRVIAVIGLWLVFFGDGCDRLDRLLAVSFEDQKQE